MMPTAVDLFCGLGGWTEGLQAEGYKVVGFDIEEHVYGEHKYPGKLILADVLTLHGSLFARADLIVASPPCQEYSYMAMPWSRAKAKAAAIRADLIVASPPCQEYSYMAMPWSRAKAKAAAIRADTTGVEHARLTQLFNACFRIQREASTAASRHIPLVVENVRGAQPWVGKAQGNFGSFYLWGDVPELPKAVKALKIVGQNWSNFKKTGEVSPHWNMQAIKAEKDGQGGYGGTFGWDGSPMRRGNSKSPQRKMASAMIAKIPLVLSTHIARHYHPDKTMATEPNPC